MIVDGPKNDGTSLDVVTGVFRSPVWHSAVMACVGTPPPLFADDSAMAEPSWDAVSRLRCGCEEVAAANEEMADALADDVLAMVVRLPP